MLADTQVAPIHPLRALRSLRKTGTAAAAAQIPALLARLDSPLDREAAGVLLASERERAALLSSGLFREQRIAVLGSSTLSALPALLTTALVERSMVPAVRMAEFNQWRLEIAAGAPSLRDLAPRIVCCLLDDHVVFEHIANETDLDAIERVCAELPVQLASWSESCQQALSGLTVLSTIPLSSLHLDRLIDYRSKARLSALFQRMNAEILALASSQRRTVVLDSARLAERAGVMFADARLRHTSAQVFAPGFLHAYAEEVARVARADLGLSKKCLALDLDNTLWGGIVGDDGVGGLQLGGGYPGSAHLELQELARDLSMQGVLLTVCSKNDAAIAHEAIASHPEMALRPAQFAEIAANWEPKPDNLRAQAEALNLGIDSFVFVDDNPVERGLMRAREPHVETLELTSDPATYAARLAAEGYFNLLELTEEDRQRSELYRGQLQRQSLERSAGSLTDYLAGLDQQLSLEPLDKFNVGRIVQLFGKTNQFNLTGRRYSEQELASSWLVLGARVVDRFGDNGLVGALAIERDAAGGWSIENFVLSCRVFSRNVEDAILGLVLQAARERGARSVRGRFVETSKNKKFARFYEQQGFGPSADESAPFEHDLLSVRALPAWVHVSRGLEAFHAF